ncbi:hypothetical protein N7478_009182 [Penicillium angulare]|uniref:uncharacterized protein n=1 Tax=Penicillium angulare TaxID=116970 RepID=UPI002541AF78|nr:uncharacterized protein N7478_009182 [Penicillium angulare]KAJ5274057.1 hypothetical protein N7478_009182 [Penicillium angulare]
MEIINTAVRRFDLIKIIKLINRICGQVPTDKLGRSIQTSGATVNYLVSAVATNTGTIKNDEGSAWVDDESLELQEFHATFA